ncbi:MAG: caspase family protein [Maricaulaceae bacterium]
MGIRRAALVSAAVGVFTASLVAAPASAAVHALIVGIDAYDPAIGVLDGAVNDAEDLEAAFTSIEAQTVVLTDAEATRARFLEEWRAMAERSAPGDVLVFTFAGHGLPLPDTDGDETEDGDTTDVDDEAFAFVDTAFEADPDAPSGFSVTGVLFDDEVPALVELAQGRQVIVVADACHSGTITRSIDPRARRGKRRKVRAIPVTAADGVKPELKPTTSSNPDNLIFFNAVPEDLEVEEITYNGEQRGALSVAFAAALRDGAADADGDGTMSKGELEAYVLDTVRVLSEGRQASDAQPPGARALSLFARETEAAEASDTLEPTPEPITPDGFPVAVLPGPDAGVGDAVVAASVRARPAKLDQHARFQLDPATGDLLSNAGDVVARLPPAPEGGFDPADLDAVLERWEALDRFKAAALKGGFSMSLSPDNGLHRESERVVLTVGPRRNAYLTLVVLSSDGTSYLAYPEPGYGDPLAVDPTAPIPLDLEVTPPFGADHFIALASSEPASDAHAALSALHGKRAGVAVWDALAGLVAAPDVEIGLHGVYTAP